MIQLRAEFPFEFQGGKLPDMNGKSPQVVNFFFFSQKSDTSVVIYSQILADVAC